MTLYGAPWCPHCKRVKRFLAAHRVRYANVDIDADPEAIDRLKEIQGGGQIIPTIVYADGTHEVNPSDEALARRIGLTVEAERSAYDLVIVGGGPAGLAAAIYAAREGIDAIVVDASALGGQAGISDCIDNYPGFPEGIPAASSPSASSSRPAATGWSSSRRCRSPPSGAMATTWSPRCPPASSSCPTPPSSPRALLTGASRFLARTSSSAPASTSAPRATARSTRGADEVIVIGGGNSALEEGLHLSEFAKRVRVLARSGLTASPVLQERVRSDPQFDVHTGMDIVELEGGRGRFAAVVARDRDSRRPTASRPPRRSCSSG